MNIIKNNIRLVNLNTVDTKQYTFCGVESIILTKDNKIILQKRGDNWSRFPGYLSSFGGQIEANETPLQAIIRELNEELGAKVQETEISFLGALTEDITNHSELIHVYFWRDLLGTITGCYEGDIKYFNSPQEIIDQPKVMDSTRWALKECIVKKLL